MRYATIVADPPWPYDDGFAQADTDGTIRVRPLPYPSMSLKEIAALRVLGRALKHVGTDDCRLFMWTTNRYIGEAFKILRTWEFAYAQTIVWHKTNPNPNGGSVAPISAEYLLVATRGSPPVAGRWPSSVISTPIERAHSKKPDVFLDLVETVSPGPYLELFSRRSRFGWDVWGNESLEGGTAADGAAPAEPWVAPEGWIPGQLAVDDALTDDAAATGRLFP